MIDEFHKRLIRSERAVERIAKRVAPTVPIYDLQGFAGTGGNAASVLCGPQPILIGQAFNSLTLDLTFQQDVTCDGTILLLLGMYDASPGDVTSTKEIIDNSHGYPWFISNGNLVGEQGDIGNNAGGANYPTLPSSTTVEIWGFAQPVFAGQYFIGDTLTVNNNIAGNTPNDEFLGVGYLFESQIKATGITRVDIDPYNRVVDNDGLGSYSTADGITFNYFDDKGRSPQPSMDSIMVSAACYHPVGPAYTPLGSNAVVIGTHSGTNITICSHYISDVAAFEIVEPGFILPSGRSGVMNYNFLARH
jgi:hypothetical protein